MTGIDALQRMFDRADVHDREEGLLAYWRYNSVMRGIAEKYNAPLPRVIAAFCALSPNNDYFGNLRSLVSVLNGVERELPLESIKVSTYKHCRDRAYGYIKGTKNFTTEVKGPKIMSFYRNVLDPQDNRWVTVDGHICAIWRDQNLTMKEAIVKGKKEYNSIADAIKRLAFANYILPNQYQATLWFTRKRIFNVRAENHFDLFAEKNDIWKTLRNIDDIRPYR